MISINTCSLCGLRLRTLYICNVCADALLDSMLNVDLDESDEDEEEG